MKDSREHGGLRLLKRQLAEGLLPRRDFLRYATLLGVSAPAAYALAGLSAPRRPAAATFPKGGRLRLGMRVLEVTSPHAFNWAWPATQVMQVAQTLTRTGQDNVTRPLLLQDWQVSEDLKTWDLNLRRGATWHSGRDLVADDVIWNLQHVLDPATGSSSLGLFKSYLLEEYDTGELDENGEAIRSTRLWDASAIEKIDDHTVRLNLASPSVAIPEYLFHYTNCILDPDGGGEFGVGANGTGPFELVEHVVGARALLRARPGYWGDGPYLDEIEIIDLGDDVSAVAGALASDQVDTVYEADISIVDTLEKNPDLTLHQATTAGTSVGQIRVDVEPFDKPEVRLALRYGLDAKRILELALRSFGLPGEHHLVCPVHPDYAPLPEMARDPQKARELLAQAGHPDGIDITIDCKQDPPWELACAQAMKEQYAEAGIRLAINVIPAAQFWDRWDQYAFSLLAWNPRPLGFMVLSLGYRAGVPWNNTGWADAEFDALLGRAEATLDVVERRTIMAEVERILQERGPIVQPIWKGVVSVTHKRVQGYRLHPAFFIFGEELAVAPT